VPARFEVRPPATEADQQRLAAIQDNSFMISPADRAAYNTVWPVEQTRVVCDQGRVVGGLTLLPAGQYFAGRRVAMTGIAAVAIAPEDRGTRAAGQLMKATVQELHAAGVPVSTLYPATVGTYRQAGYELAGLSCHAEVPCHRIRGGDAERPMRALTPADNDRVRPVYTAWAQTQNGMLDRAPIHWWRFQRKQDDGLTGYGVFDGDTLTGYTYISTHPGKAHHPDIVVADMAASDEASVRRLLGFYARERYQKHAVLWRCGPADPFLYALQDVGAHVYNEYWMTRVTHLPSALTERGYPAGLTTELILDLRDDVVPEQAGLWQLTLEAGQPHVEPLHHPRAATPDRTLRLDARALAALYTGFAEPTTLVHTGQVAGTAQAQAAARAVFAVPCPFMSDGF
jgi:predicted acetyltransferase